MPRWPMKMTPDKWTPTHTEIVYADTLITCDSVYVASEDEGTGSHYVDGAQGGWKTNQRTKWQVTITAKGRTIDAPYTMGSAHTVPPAVSDVLYCLFSDAQCGDNTFEDFCSDLGYDDDSRTAERNWKECQATELNLRRMFGASYDAIAELAQDQ